MALGGAIGAVLRYGITLVSSQDKGIAWEIILVNLIGSFLICFVFFKFADLSEATRLFLFVGIFGGFTTMSAVSLNFMELFTGDQAWYAFLAVLLNVSACVGGGFLGKAVASII